MEKKEDEEKENNSESHCDRQVETIDFQSTHTSFIALYKETFEYSSSVEEEKLQMTHHTFENIILTLSYYWTPSESKDKVKS